MSWADFAQSEVHQPTGPVENANTGKVKVPKIGQVFGVKDDPDCDGTGYEYGVYVEWDSEEGFKGHPFAKKVPGVNCRDLVVGIPKDAVVVGLRHFASNSKGKDYRERTGDRNKIESHKHEWAKRERVRSRVVGNRRDLMVRCKNWRRSFSRYFGFGVEFQLRHRYEAAQEAKSFKIDIYHDTESEATAERLLAALEESEVGDRVVLALRDAGFLQGMTLPGSALEIRFGEAERAAAEAVARFTEVDLGDGIQVSRLPLSHDSTPGVLSFFLFADTSRSAPRSEA